MGNRSAYDPYEIAAGDIERAFDLLDDIIRNTCQDASIRAAVLKDHLKRSLFNEVGPNFWETETTEKAANND